MTQAVILHTDSVVSEARLSARNNMEFTQRQLLPMNQPYIPTALVTLAILTLFPWAASCVCGFYTAYRIGLFLVLPLFPAEPKIDAAGLATPVRRGVDLHDHRALELNRTPQLTDRA